VSDLPKIGGHIAWLDLRDGQQAVLSGRLELASLSGLVITGADWSQLSVNADDARTLTHFKGRQVRLVVTRTEDGLFATADAIASIIVEPQRKGSAR
jgi:hypothetical protein